MDERVVVFVDYQNLHDSGPAAVPARQCHERRGHVDPLRLAQLLTRLRRRPSALQEVRVYGGRPGPAHQPLAAAATTGRPQRGSAALGSPSYGVRVRYRHDWPTTPATEKGIDVALAVDMVRMATTKEYDAAILFSSDTDLMPAIETIMDPKLGHVEISTWAGAKRLRRPNTQLPFCHFVNAVEYATLRASTSESGLPPGQPWPDHPFVHEVNTAVWLGEVSRRAGRPLSLADAPAHEWDAVVPSGITVVWLMGVLDAQRRRTGRSPWPTLRYEQSWSSALPDWTDDDVAGSPYCICDYDPDPSIGGWAGLDAARQQLRARGAGLMVDWVPNHVGPDSPWLLEAPEAFVRGTAEDGRGRARGLRADRGHDLRPGQGPVLPAVAGRRPGGRVLAGLRTLAAAALTEIADTPTRCAATWRCSCSTTS